MKSRQQRNGARSTSFRTGSRGLRGPMCSLRFPEALKRRLGWSAAPEVCVNAGKQSPSLGVIGLSFQKLQQPVNSIFREPHGEKGACNGHLPGGER